MSDYADVRGRLAEVVEATYRARAEETGYLPDFDRPQVCAEIVQVMLRELGAMGDEAMMETATRAAADIIPNLPIPTARRVVHVAAPLLLAHARAENARLEAENARLEKEAKLWKLSIVDAFGDMPCLPDCNSHGHAENCPAVDAPAAFRALRQRAEAAEQRGDRLQLVIDDIDRTLEGAEAPTTVPDDPDETFMDIDSRVEWLSEQRNIAEQQGQQAYRSLENVKALTMRIKHRGWNDEYADHLMRFCAEAGVVPNILRAVLARPASGDVIVDEPLPDGAFRGGIPPVEIENMADYLSRRKRDERHLD